MPVQTGDAAGSMCHACQQCHGLFIGPRSWCAFIAQPELALAFEARLGPRATPPKELLALLSCPTCKRQMERGRFAASSSVVVDVCTAHGTWLDAGELSDVVKHGSTRAASATAPTDVAAYNEALRYHLSAAMRPVVVAQPPAKRNVPLAIILFLLFALLSALGGAKAMSSSKEKLDDAAKAAGSAGQELR
jgi:Zn-finger nucleic acid-binding protein